MSTTPKRSKQSPSKHAAANQGFSAEEKAAMRARARELKAAEDGETAVLAAIAAMAPPAPGLAPKTWYGMPAYAKDGKVVCYFRNATKFKERYALFGFNDSANLDQGSMWPVAYALTELTAKDETKLRTLLKKAVS
jgi:hypothetical protein